LNKKILALVFVALFAAIISAGALLAIPIGPVPIALQNFFTLLSGLVLGPALGSAAVGLFLVAGAVGAPVFANSGASMGMARLLGPTGGFLIGYLLGALVAGLIVGGFRMGSPRPGEKIPIWRYIVAVVAGLLIVYAPGLIRLKWALNIGWPQTLAAGFLPFLIGDAVKGVLAVLIAPRLRKTAAQLLSS